MAGGPATDATPENAAPAGLAGRRVLVTAGPTYEPIDPVRFLGNRSSGKMGFAIAAEAAARGARTTLVAGPVALPTPPGVERVDVETALEMRDAVYRLAPDSAVVVMAAAVADFRPLAVAPGKLKKADGPPRLELVANPDILAGLADVAPDSLRVGFAAETADDPAEARAKLERKRVHWLVWNDVSRRDIGFAAERNEVVVHRRDGAPIFLSRRPKAAVAAALLDLVTTALEERDAPLASAR